MKKKVKRISKSSKISKKKGSTLKKPTPLKKVSENIKTRGTVSWATLSRKKAIMALAARLVDHKCVCVKQSDGYWHCMGITSTGGLEACGGRYSSEADCMDHYCTNV